MSAAEDQDAIRGHRADQHLEYPQDTKRPRLSDGKREGEVNPNDGGPISGYVSSSLSELLITEVEAFFQSEVLPRCKDVEEEVAALQEECEGLGLKTEEEKEVVMKELGRLSDLIVNFQKHIVQFLDLV